MAAHETVGWLGTSPEYWSNDRQGQFRAGCEQPVRQCRLAAPAPAQIRNFQLPTCSHRARCVKQQERSRGTEEGLSCTGLLASRLLWGCWDRGGDLYRTGGIFECYGRSFLVIILLIRLRVRKRGAHEGTYGK